MNFEIILIAKSQFADFALFRPRIDMNLSDVALKIRVFIKTFTANRTRMSFHKFQVLSFLIFLFVSGFEMLKQIVVSEKSFVAQMTKGIFFF